MMVRRKIQIIRRVCIGLTALLLLATAAQAATLLNLRMGVTDKRTRLVYHFDSLCPYEVSFDSTTVFVKFDSLNLSDQVSKQLSSTGVGILDDVVSDISGQKITLKLRISQPFYVRYFDLMKPDRLVVDLYAKQTESPLAGAAAAENEASGKSEAPTEKNTQSTPAQPDTGISNEQATVSDTTSQPVLTASSEPEQPARTASETDNPPPQEEIKTGNSTGLWLGLLALAVVILIIVVQAFKKRPKVEVKTTPVAAVSDDRAQIDRRIQELAVGEEPVLETPVEFSAEPEEIIPDEPAVPSVETAAIEESAPAQAPSTEPEINPEKIIQEFLAVPEETPATLEISEDLTSDDEEESEIEELIESPELTEQKPPRIMEEATPEFNFEEAILTWPVQVITADRPGKIMVVDDEEDIVKVLEGFLVQEKYSVLGLTDSQEALQKYPDWRPDIVITDVVMPKLSGVELVQRIQQVDLLDKVIFLSGRAERDSVGKVFSRELEDGRFEFFRKPLSLVQIGARIRDFFRTAREMLSLRLQDGRVFEEQIKHLGPYQLLPLQRYLWDRIFEISSNYLGRRIESYFITDRMEPPANYMRKVGCQEREDYCIANICFGSNPICAANKIRSELEVMRKIISELRDEYIGRVSRGVGQEELRPTSKKKHKVAVKTSTKTQQEAVSSELPARRVLRKLAPDRKR
ncbi:MAG: response regulator [bacterium]|nr:response regulator [bacterium]